MRKKIKASLKVGILGTTLGKFQFLQLISTDMAQKQKLLKILK